ncbi:hypothetical protein WG66_003143 [Moniliophthora roreri]|uniref:Uncharacterized protein n=1 Tax=Moniliophthora roreri TaxID=221103 RepID=A0A0W0FJP8_MONRR|nr:hypothetical protein WG66_003143 [Moniliophthora roreri]
MSLNKKTGPKEDLALGHNKTLLIAFRTLQATVHTWAFDGKRFQKGLFMKGPGVRRVW